MWVYMSLLGCSSDGFWDLGDVEQVGERDGKWKFRGKIRDIQKQLGKTKKIGREIEDFGEKTRKNQYREKS